MDDEPQQQPSHIVDNIKVTSQNANGFDILTTAFNATKIFGIFIWYLFQDLCSKIYSRQKIIRNQFVLITGSGSNLGISPLSSPAPFFNILTNAYNLRTSASL
jgi:hypothetical protein